MDKRECEKGSFVSSGEEEDLRVVATRAPTVREARLET
jgi:hypothetical protein